MIDKVEKKTYNVGTNWIGVIIGTLGAMDVTGMDIDWIVQSVMDEPLKSALTFAMWVLFYVSGKDPKPA